ncbi:MAG TPA: manganese catalase family protein [Humisphaera sp.]
MFFHDKRLQYHAKPERPDPLYAKKLQEVLGGQWGEITVMLQYLFQGWNCRGPAKYRDMLLDIGTEEIAHVEMLATMISRLLEGADADDQQAAAKGSSVVGAILGGTSPKDAIIAAAMNPQHAIVSGLGATVADSVGFPWQGRYVTASGNLLADFRYNLTAESMGRLQVCRLYEMTTDSGVRDMLSFLIARDTMHQNQWMAAIAQLEADGLEATPCPSAFPQELEKRDVSYQFLDCSTGGDSAQGAWASGPTPDGRGQFQYVAQPAPMGEVPVPAQVDPRFWGTPATPASAAAGNKAAKSGK